MKELSLEQAKLVSGGEDMQTVMIQGNYINSLDTSGWNGAVIGAGGSGPISKGAKVVVTVIAEKVIEKVVDIVADAFSHKPDPAAEQAAKDAEKAAKEAADRAAKEREARERAAEEASDRAAEKIRRNRMNPDG